MDWRNSYLTDRGAFFGSSGATTAAPPVTEKATDARTRLTPLYRVLVHNDDLTPAIFVVYVLISIFKKEQAEAIEIMETAHHTGLALVTVLPLEQAELRTDQAHALSRTQKYPLTFTYEPA